MNGKVEWRNYKDVLSEYQDIVKNRSEEISKIINDVFYDLNRWENTKDQFAERNESKDMADSFDNAINALNAIMLSAHTRLDSVFVTQKKMIKAVKDGFDRATFGNTKALDERINKFIKFFSEPIVKNDIFDIVYIKNGAALDG